MQELLMCVCISLCTTLTHNTAQNNSDNFPSYPPDSYHCSDDVYWMGGSWAVWEIAFWQVCNTLLQMAQLNIASYKQSILTVSLSRIISGSVKILDLG